MLYFFTKCGASWLVSSWFLYGFTQAKYLRLHFAESYNELHHLLIMEELGGNLLYWDRYDAHYEFSWPLDSCLPGEHGDSCERLIRAIIACNVRRRICGGTLNLLHIGGTKTRVLDPCCRGSKRGKLDL